MDEFLLDRRLQEDTWLVGDLALCRVLLMNDRRYLWAILVPRRPGIVEVIDLHEEQQQQLWRESLDASKAILNLSPGAKLNLATLGNVVSQLHLHVIARRPGDPAWPGPVWGHSPAEPYSEESAQQLVVQLRQVFGM